MQEHAGSDKSCVWHTLDFADYEFRRDVRRPLWILGYFSEGQLEPIDFESLTHGFLETNQAAEILQIAGSAQARLRWRHQVTANDNGEDGEEEEAGRVGRPRARLTREQRELQQLRNVPRKDDFICFERVKGHLVNILAGLELHAGVFSTSEQKHIVGCVYDLQDMGKRGELGGIPILSNLMAKVHCLLKRHL